VLSPKDERRVVVAGCAGFIGQHLVKQLLGQDFSVVGIDNFSEELYESTARRNGIVQLCKSPNFQFLNADLLNMNFDCLLGSDVVFNMAGIGSQDRSWKEPRRYEQLNVELAINLFRAARLKGVRRFIHASSSSVYGDIANGDEAQPFNPCSPYGKTKVQAEAELTRTAAGSGELVILRFFSVYGPGQRTDMGFYQIINSALAGHEVPVHDRPGLMRDFTSLSLSEKWDTCCSSTLH
jgi:UDP-glucuronate 4-epimerase